MVELRALLLPDLEPLRLRNDPKVFAEASLRPLARGLIFLAALSLPVLGSVAADRFHGSAPRPAQVVAALSNPPRDGAAANPWAAVPSRLAQAKLGRSLSLR